MGTRSANNLLPGVKPPVWRCKHPLRNPVKAVMALFPTSERFCRAVVKVLYVCVPVLLFVSMLLLTPLSASATPANRIGMEKLYGRFLPARLNACTTCHLPSTTGKPPTSLLDFPHNAFGHRLAVAAEELRKLGRKTDIATRLRAIEHEDSDGDGIDNLTEILLGYAPGDRNNRPTAKELAQAALKRAAFARFMAEYRWQPFEPVPRVPLPKSRNAAWNRNPVDAFLAQEHETHHLMPRPPASRTVLLRRVYMDLVGLSPTPAEVTAFETDTAPDAYEKVVDRLLASPRYGERWGRHWMDVWRYSDWAGWADGNQIRDSKPFIWRWRDWIVESLNNDKGYDRMVQEMLAADELCPDDPDALRATGFLVRNFKLLSREQWLEDTLNHTSRAFLGLTLHCAKCHDHMYDPIRQEEYYRVRAIFEPHNVRTDRIPNQPDVAKDGLVRAFDADPAVPTYLFVRGDERNPDKTHALVPGVPESLGGKLTIQPVSLTRTASVPDRRDFVVRETVAASQAAVAEARKAVDQASLPTTQTGSTQPTQPASAVAARTLAQRTLTAAQARHEALLAVLRGEQIEDTGDKSSEMWKAAATEVVKRQRELAAAEAEQSAVAARQALETARTTPPPPVKDGKRPDTAALLAEAQAKVVATEKALAVARQALQTPLTTAYQPRALQTFPAQSTGRRLAFARWLTDTQNPLTARVAVNQIWMRHFGQGIVPSMDDFGRNGRPPSHPQLLDWLAARLMADHWRMKPLHRLLVTSNAYRMASTPDSTDAKIDPDNRYLWRMSSRRLEAEAVRDNLLYVAGSLDEMRGGPEVDHLQGLVSRRRSLYLRTAAEKQVEFMSIFDGPSVTECYARKPSVMPQQALALANSELALAQARILAHTLSEQTGADNNRFLTAAFLRVLARRPTHDEQQLCLRFLEQQSQLEQQTRKEAQLPGGTQPTMGPAASPLPVGTQKVASVTSATEQAKAVPQKAVAGSTPDATARNHAREHLILVLFNHNDFVTVR